MGSSTVTDSGWPGRGRIRGVQQGSAELQGGPEAGDRLQRPGQDQLPLGDWNPQGRQQAAANGPGKYTPIYNQFNQVL